MERVSVSLQHCYGIKTLNHEFDFFKTRAHAIYAPNGAMKSSLAQTFKDAAEGKESRDRIFPARKTIRKIKDAAGADVNGGRVLVLLPYDPQFAPSEKTSTLLIEPKLRNEYEQLHIAIDDAKGTLLNLLKQHSKSKVDIEAEISLAIMKTPNDFRGALRRLQPEILELNDLSLADVEYDKVFSQALIDALNTKGLKDSIREYIDRYDELLEASVYFSRGTFDFYNASQVAAALAKNGFFAAKHTVNLTAQGVDREITTQEELESVIRKEKEKILKDDRLLAAFTAVEKQLDRNIALRGFREYLADNKYILSRLDNLDKLKDDVIKSYLKLHEDTYTALMDKYQSADMRRKQIEAAAEEQRTQWEEVIDIFNERFVVPFELKPKNRTAVILGNSNVMELGFAYRDGNESTDVERDDLLNSLSTGEKKAFYVLNIMFEIERRKKDNEETLVVIDDVADSFDYQNKYAIVQYLKDISDDGLFKQIILTHNFDFLRTIESRFVSYANCWMASKNNTEVTLQRASGIRNIFVNDLKNGFYSDDKKKVAAIPFLRNLIEFGRGGENNEYLQLTSMVHWKADSASLTVADLDRIYNAECKETGISTNQNQSVIDLIDATAEKCLKAPPELGLVNKVVLAIAIRLRAERYIADKVADPAFLSDIKAHQTQTLIAKFREKFSAETAAIVVLDRVALMTPENIHLNSFMYEPIIDMGEAHLRKLYVEVKALQ